MASKNASNLPGEFEIIKEIFAPLAVHAPGALGLKDDAAWCAVPAGHDMIVTADALVEGVHFSAEDPPALIARKALRVNLSDLAAKGANPEGYLLTISIAPWVNLDWLKEFSGGLAADQDEFGISLIGGDTTSTTGPLTLSITVLGSTPSGAMLRRSGAFEDQIVFVTGTIGDAGAGLAILDGEGDDLSDADRDLLVRRYFLPEPRLYFGGLMRGIATASIDVSDGLIADLGHIANASGIEIVLEAARIPISPPLVNLWGDKVDTIIRASTAGDDYEIAFTAPASLRQPLKEAADEVGVAVSEIGRVRAGRGVTLLDESGRPLDIKKSGFTHF